MRGVRPLWGCKVRQEVVVRRSEPLNELFDDAQDPRCRAVKKCVCVFRVLMQAHAQLYPLAHTGTFFMYP